MWEVGAGSKTESRKWKRPVVHLREPGGEIGDCPAGESTLAWYPSVTQDVSDELSVSSVHPMGMSESKVRMSPLSLCFIRSVKC